MTDNLPTPPASSAAPSQHASPLPQARRRPLNPGGPKESELITYLDHSIAQVQKRIADRHRKRGTAAGGAAGYRAFWEVAKDLDSLVDVVWVSGSRMLRPVMPSNELTVHLQPIYRSRIFCILLF